MQGDDVKDEPEPEVSGILELRQCLGFCAATDFLSSLAYESAEQKPKHCLTPGFMIPLARFPPRARALSRQINLSHVNKSSDLEKRAIL